MKRKLYFDDQQFIQTNANNDLDSEILRLHIHPTTTIHPCYLYDLSPICNSERFYQSNLNHHHYPDWNRKRSKKWKSLKRKLITTNKKSSTAIVYAPTTQTQNNSTERSPVILQQRHFYYGFFVFLFIISILTFGFILWYFFIRSAQSPKSSIRLATEDSDSDDNNQHRIRRLTNDEPNFNTSNINKTVDLPFLDNNTNYAEGELSHNTSFNNNRNDYENIQILIQNLQQSDFESINSSIIGKILSDLIHRTIKVVNLQSSADLLTFLSYTPQYFHILRTIISHKCSCQPLNPTNFLQYQYLIDILHSSELILEYLHRYYSYEKIFLVNILTQLYQILSSMNNNSYRNQYICHSLVNILQELNRKHIS